jgi:hypothetical protein
MPRSGGVYSLPAGSIVVNGTTIEAAQHNTPLNDIAADLNAARPISSGGTGAASASAARTALGLEIGTNVQAQNATLQAIATAGNVPTANLADGAVTTPKIGDGQVTTAKVADANVTFPKLDPAAVVTASETINSNDNDTTLPTSAAVKDRVEAAEARDFLWSQTPQDVSVSRTWSTSYQNTTGRPIWVVIRSNNSTTRDVEISPDNSTWVVVSSLQTGSQGVPASFPVPSGYYYRVNGTLTTIITWTEIR